MIPQVKCINCKNLRRDGWCEQIADSPHEDPDRRCVFFKPCTNGDYIRRMTDKELADFMHNICIYVGEDDEPYISIYNLDSEEEEEVSYGDLLNWLKEEHNVEKQGEQDERILCHRE